VGAIYAWLVLRTSGLELTVGAHAAHNVANTWLLEPLSPDPPTVAAGPDLTLAYAAVNVGVAIAFLLAVTLLLRTKPLRALVEQGS
jgi:membrane protease YdiL (CAAX protease family)